MTTAAAEPCLTCGEETAVGSIFFSDRIAISDRRGRTGFRCALCDAEARRLGRPTRLTEAEARRLAETGSMLDIVWSNGR